MNKIFKLFCLILVASSLRLEASNIIFTAQSATNTPVNPSINITSESGGPFTVGTNMIFAGINVQLTNGFYEVSNLAPNCYAVSIQTFGVRLRMCVPNDTNTYNWTQLITNGLYANSNNTAFIITNDLRAVTLTNTKNIFAGDGSQLTGISGGGGMATNNGVATNATIGGTFYGEGTGAFVGDGSALLGLWFLPLTNSTQTITITPSGAFIVQDENLLTRFRADSTSTSLNDPNGTAAFRAFASQDRIVYDQNGISQIQLEATNLDFFQNTTFASNITAGTFTGNGSGLTNLNAAALTGFTTNVAYVATFGNDATGALNSPGLPFASVHAAVAVLNLTYNGTKVTNLVCSIGPGYFNEGANSITPTNNVILKGVSRYATSLGFSTTQMIGLNNGVAVEDLTVIGTRTDGVNQSPFYDPSYFGVSVGSGNGGVAWVQRVQIFNDSDGFDFAGTAGITNYLILNDIYARVHWDFYVVGTNTTLSLRNFDLGSDGATANAGGHGDARVLQLYGPSIVQNGIIHAFSYTYSPVQVYGVKSGSSVQSNYIANVIFDCPQSAGTTGLNDASAVASSSLVLANCSRLDGTPLSTATGSGGSLYFSSQQFSNVIATGVISGNGSGITNLMANSAASTNEVHIGATNEIGNWAGAGMINLSVLTNLCFVGFTNGPPGWPLVFGLTPYGATNYVISVPTNIACIQNIYTVTNGTNAQFTLASNTYCTMIFRYATNSATVPLGSMSVDIRVQGYEPTATGKNLFLNLLSLGNNYDSRYPNANGSLAIHGALSARGFLFTNDDNEDLLVEGQYNQQSGASGNPLMLGLYSANSSPYDYMPALVTPSVTASIGFYTNSLIASNVVVTNLLTTPTITVTNAPTFQATNAAPGSVTITGGVISTAPTLWISFTNNGVAYTIPAYPHP